MDIDGLVEHLIQMQKEGKGKYKVLAHEIDYNTANGGQPSVNENQPIDSFTVDDNEKTITFGDYFEYYSY